MAWLIHFTAIQWMTFLTAAFGFALLVLGMVLAWLEHQRNDAELKDVKSALHLDSTRAQSSPAPSDLSELQQAASAAGGRTSNAEAAWKTAKDDQAKAAAYQKLQDARAEEKKARDDLRVAQNADSPAAGEAGEVRTQGAVESGLDAAKTFVEVLPKLASSAKLVLASLLLIAIAAALAGVQYAIPHAKPQAAISHATPQAANPHATPQPAIVQVVVPPWWPAL